MTKFKTEQEEFWAGEFGNEYVERNSDLGIVAGNVAMFSEIFSHVLKIDSLLEFGANIGLNLRAIRQLMPRIELGAIEINDIAAEQLKSIDAVKVYHQSILDFEPDRTWDFVLVKTVLIHLNPDMLPNVYDKLYRSSGKYICVAEYYNPEPVQVVYRGHQNKLFKRDFAGEMIGRFEDLELAAYGFTYNKDPKYSFDSTNWFLLEKTK